MNKPKERIPVINVQIERAWYCENRECEHCHPVGYWHEGEIVTCEKCGQKYELAGEHDPHDDSEEG